MNEKIIPFLKQQRDAALDAVAHLSAMIAELQAENQSLKAAAAQACLSTAGTANSLAGQEIASESTISDLASP